MTWRPQPLPPVPEATVTAVRAAFPRGNLSVDLRAEFGTLYEDHLFADLYADHGRPVDVAPWRLALVMVMQSIEGLTDRQAADAVRRCIDWQYALSLELTDPGFDFTLLHDFRDRWLTHEATQRTHGQGRLCWVSRGSLARTSLECVSLEAYPWSLWPSSVVCKVPFPRVFDLTNRVGLGHV